MACDLRLRQQGFRWHGWVGHPAAAAVMNGSSSAYTLACLCVVVAAELGLLANCSDNGVSLLTMYYTIFL
jgi:hypothetical protein